MGVGWSKCESIKMDPREDVSRGQLGQQRASRGRLRVCVIPAQSSDLDSELAEPFSYLPEWIEKTLPIVTPAIILGCACYMPLAELFCAPPHFFLCTP